MMLDFIKRLCESNNLTVHEFNSSLEWLNSQIAIPGEGSANQEYYFILESEHMNDDLIDEILDKHAEELMDKLEGLDYVDESLRKNSTLILCSESGRVSDRQLLKFEEDPYYFKKNVITYSKEELFSLKDKLNNDYTNEHLNNLLMENNGDLFESFKIASTLGADYYYYPLLVRIITKLPFVHYMPRPNQLDDLKSYTRNTLDESDIKLFDFIFEGDFSPEGIDEKIALEWPSND
ncbi:MAG: hypothetical protein L3J98_14310 [Gammaproteobacteria bacterium]|nr:hypothetical protein [Gammaproteobacteria bacterium]MCF6261310.1 hypothetical protein [Gammaproteobacteria bacterium]